MVECCLDTCQTGPVIEIYLIPDPRFIPILNIIGSINSGVSKAFPALPLQLSQAL